MKNLQCIVIIFVFNIFLLLSPATASARGLVFVSILRQKFFVQQISGNLLDIEVMVEPGASPATYDPKPSQMRKLATSKAYFAIGVPFENVWLDKLQGVNPDMHLVHTDAGIEKIAMKAHIHDEDAHGNRNTNTVTVTAPSRNRVWTHTYGSLPNW